MSSSAFDGTPARREDVSMRLRVQRMKNVAEQTKLLEEESRKMEERLQELKLAMGREKEEREKQGGGFWKTGQHGALANHAQKVLNSSADLAKTKDGKPRKIKVIKDEPNVAPASSAGGKGNRAPAVPGTMAFLLQKENANASQGSHQPRGTASGRVGSRSAAAPGGKSSPLCGQCEQQAAVVSCFECSEQYCAHCFASFHLRGALKKHRSAPLIANAAAPAPPTNQSGEGRRGQSSAALAAAEQQQPPPPSERSSLGAEESGRGSATQRWAVPAQHRPAQGDKSGPSATKTAATLLASHANWKSEGSLEVVRKERDPEISTSSVVRAQEADANVSLLDGAFNEEDSALSFQEALKQWRMSSAAKSDSSTATKLPLHTAVTKPWQLEKSHEITATTGIDEGTSTASLKRVPYEPEFQSSGGLKYADRLLLKAHRRTELGPMTERSNSVRDRMSPSARMPSVTNGSYYSDDETADGADIEEPPLDFAQLRDLATPRVQDFSNGSVNRPVVEEVVDIVEADNLSDDGPVEAVHYTVIEDGEILEELVQPAEQNSKKAAGKSFSKAKKDVSPAVRTSSDRLDRRSELASDSHASTSRATQPSHVTVKAKLRKPGASDTAFSATAAMDKATGKAAASTSTGGSSQNSEQSSTGKATDTDAGTISADQLPSARTERRAQSRPSSRARPPTRARSRAEKAAELRKGGLSLEPSNGLKEVSCRLNETPDGAVSAVASHVDVLGEFFRLWIPAEQVERTLTPTSHKKTTKDSDKDGSLAGLPKHHVNNKIYLTSPQVWRPHSSTAEAVAEEEALRYVSSLPQDNALAALGDGEKMADLVESNPHALASIKASIRNESSNATDGLHYQPSAPVALKQEAEGPSRLPTNDGSSSARLDPMGSGLLRLRPQRATTPRRSVDRHNAPRRAGSQLSASQRRRDEDTSRGFSGRAEVETETTAETKDSMASYDLVIDITQSSEGSDELRTLDELERELASQTGRLTAEGIKSCLPDSLDAEDKSPTRGDGIVGNRVDKGDAINVSGNDVQRSWDLRESMMHDFEDMEQAFADEMDE